MFVKLIGIVFMSEKVALMITGLARTYRQTYESLHKHLLSPNNGKIDIFLCLWDQTHLRRMDYHKGQKLYEIKDKSVANIDDVLEHYNPKAYTILKTDDYTEEINSTLQSVLSKKNFLNKERNMSEMVLLVRHFVGISA